MIDLRIAKLDVRGTYGAQRVLSVAAVDGDGGPFDLGAQPLTVDLGGVEQAVEIDGSNATVTLAFPDDGPPLPLVLSIDGAPITEGTALLSHRGTSSPDLSLTVTVAPISLSLTVVGGGNAVDSVNAQTGAVVLDAGDVGADPAGSAASAVAAHSADTTAVHGIADTSALVATSDPRLSDARTPLGHAASHQDGGADELSLSQAQITGLAATLAAQMPWRVEIDPLLAAAASVGTWTRTVDSADLYCGRLQSGGAQNDRIDFPVTLGAGTWTLELIHQQRSSAAIYTVQLDDGAGSFTTIGTIDGYAGSTTRNVLSTITGIAVATPVKRTLRILLATHNASSSGYLGLIQRIGLHRTA